MEEWFVRLMEEGTERGKVCVLENKNEDGHFLL